MTATNVAPAQAMSQMLLGNRVQQAIYVAAKLGIADLLTDGPLSCDELATASGSNPGALHRLLRALAGLGIFCEEGPGRFALTPLASLLRTDVPDSLHPVAIWSGAMAYSVFGGLEYSVTTGEPAFDHLYGEEFFEYLAHDPVSAERFDAFMTRQTAPVAAALADSCDFSDVDVVVDVGGGQGQLLAAILQKHPGMSGVLFDQAHVIERANAFVNRSGVAGRCRLVAGDMMTGVPPGGDAYLLKSIVHALDDESAVTLLERCRTAIGDGRGRVVLVEFVIPEGNGPHPGKLLDLVTMLGTHGGRERTAAEFESLLVSSGFRMGPVTHLNVAWSVIDGLPV